MVELHIFLRFRSKSEGNLICLINISSDLEVSLGELSLDLDMRDDTFCTPFSPNFLPASVAAFIFERFV